MGQCVRKCDRSFVAVLQVQLPHGLIKVIQILKPATPRHARENFSFFDSGVDSPAVPQM